MVRHGILLIDKPQGPTSHDVVEMARHALGIRQIGHMGTLDPLATGLLILGVGEGTKLAPFLSDLDKTYQCTARLGARSTTYDAMGTIEAAGDAGAVSLEQIETAAAQFRGTLEQKPPVFSAIKKAGRPLYDYARRGEPVETPPRRVRVYALEVLAWNPPDLSLHIHVSSGTYIRSIVHDLGEALGVGAYVSQLRRTQAGPFGVNDAATIANAEEGFSSNIEKAWRTLAQALGHWTRVRIPDPLIGAVKNGATVNATGLEVAGEALHHDRLYALVDGREHLLAVARCLVSRGDVSVAGGGARRGDLVLKPVRGFNEE